MAPVLRLALGNVRRCVRDYALYLATLAFAVCLLYTFASVSDYLVAIGADDARAAVFSRVSGYLMPLGLLSAIVFAFLATYANRFLVRRRKPELALYGLVGMGWGRCAALLLAETGLVSLLALAVGVAAGLVLSPVLGLVAAWAFGVAWAPAPVLSATGVAFASACFATIAVASGVGSVLELRHATLAELLRADRRVEAPVVPAPARTALRLVLGVALLSAVYATCTVFATRFFALMVPVCLAACAGTFLVFRALATIVPAALRRDRPLYDRGLTPFVVRQLESRVLSSCGALTCASALIAVGVCMVALAVGMRQAAPPADPADVTGSALVGMCVYVGVFYGITFLVTAAATLALQQLSQAVESRGRYAFLREMGVSDEMLSHAVLAQTAAYFLVPGAMALVHDVFGLSLVRFVIGALVPVDATSLMVVVVAATAVAFLGYLFVAYRGCRRSALSPT